MKVYIEKEKKHIELSAANGSDLLDKLSINPTTVLLIRNDEVILPDEELVATDDVKILSVVSGG